MHFTISLLLLPTLRQLHYNECQSVFEKEKVRDTINEAWPIELEDMVCLKDISQVIVIILSNNAVS